MEAHCLLETQNIDPVEIKVKEFITKNGFHLAFFSRCLAEVSTVEEFSIE